MERVPQKVLNWLHSVLIGEYFDVNRTFGDVARALETYQTLRPSTDVYTFENGSSALLLRLSGTLPVAFRGGRYSFPVSIWIPKSFPTEAPLAFVVPTQEMVVRSGQHVSGEGRIYHPYLANWRPQCQLVELLKLLEDVFSREPPVVAKSSGPSRPAPQPTTVAPPRPPLPTELRRDTPNSYVDRPPSLPPKPFEQRPSSAAPLSPQSALQSRPPPPLPPPQEYRQPIVQTRHQILPPNQVPPQSSQQYLPSQVNPPLQARTSAYQVSTPSQFPNQITAAQGITGQPPSWVQQTHPQQLHSQNHVPTQSIQTQPQPPKPQTLDLLTSPFDPPLPLQAENLPAPPIPPNPEKDALLSAISHTLTTQLQSVVTSNAAAIQPLSAQHAAMTHALHNLQQERGALLQLQSLLDSNEQILHQAMHDADECIASARHKAVPGVDEVLVAPTVVGQQLYDLIAEEKASIETRDVLARALDRGRISSEVWVKTVRSLAREEFLKKVLIKRCAKGMGLQRDINT